jgi:hypothetical protein
VIADAIAELLGIPPQRGEEWQIACPAPEHDDARPSASIYVGEPTERLRGGKKVMRLPGMWTCYSCHRSGRISSEAIETYEPTFDRNLQVAIDQLETTERRVYPESWLDLWEFPGGVHPYWLDRFPEWVCRRHRLGYDFERMAGTYPFRSPTGEVLGVVRRSFDLDTTGWKYRYPAGVDKSALLYGYHWAVQEQSKWVVLGEGALDAVACWEVGAAGLAIYGSRIAAEQVRLLNRLYPTTILLAFDDDDAGHAAAEQVLTHPDLACIDVRTVDLRGANDIADIPARERAEVLRDALDPELR